MSRVTVAIIGSGPWGLAVLERVLFHARSAVVVGWQVAIHIFQPGLPGSGVHSPDKPDYLLMNTVCGQVSLFGANYFPEHTGEPVGLRGCLKTPCPWVLHGGPWGMLPRKPYPSDLTDEEYALIEPLLPACKSGKPQGGRPKKHPRREILNAIRYIARSAVPGG